MEIRTQEDLRAIIAGLCQGRDQDEVADELGMSQSTISLILSGKRGISEAVAERLGYEKKTVFIAAQGAAQGRLSGDASQAAAQR